MGFIILVLFLSCDVLRSSPFEIAGWSPGEGYCDVNGGVTIAVQFSHEPDRSSVERSFEFSEDGVKSNGRIAWPDDDKLVFTPSSPLQSGHDYAVIINTDAQDTQGVSLETRFEGRWTTRPIEDRPSILAAVPDDGDVIAAGYTGVVIEFSTAVSVNACNGHISFSPQMKGSWALDNSGKKAFFAPDAVWQHGTEYKMTIDAAFESLAGNTLGQEWVIHFTVEGETVPPEGETVPPEGETVPPEGETVPPEGETVPPEGETVPPEGETVPPEGETVPPEGETVPPEGETVPPEGETVPPEGETVPPGGETVPPEGETVPPEGETVPPLLTDITALDENGDAVQRGDGVYTLTEVFAENADWESFYKLLFRFSESVDVSSVKKAVTVEPSLSFAIDTKEAFSDTVILSFIDRPEFQQRYLIKLNSGIKDVPGNESTEKKSYRIYVDGKKSKPPELKKLQITSGNVSTVYELDQNFGAMSHPSNNAATFTFWFETAEGAAINRYSLMECFSVSSTNNAVSFSSSSIEYAAADGKYTRVIITGILTCNAFVNGVVAISVGPGLLDSYGNKQTKAQSIVLLK
jgi:hypothetical protein